MSALQQIQAIIDYFFRRTVEFRDGQDGTSELWAKQDGIRKFKKFAILYGNESLTNIELIDNWAGVPVQIEQRYRGMSYALDVLMRELEAYTGTGHIISVSCGSWQDAEVDALALYGTDEHGEPYYQPAIARFRFDSDQDTLSAR